MPHMNYRITQANAKYGVIVKWWCSGFPQVSQTQNQGEDRRVKGGFHNF